MNVRKRQMEALADANRRASQNELKEHIRAFAPRLAAVAGESGLEAYVSKMQDRANSYALYRVEPVRFFIDAGCVLGHEFHRDPQYPWAAGVLADPELQEEDQRARILADHLFDYMNMVCGPKNEYAVRALQNLSNRCQEHFEQLPILDRNSALGWMREIYPEKFSYVGSSSLSRLFDGAMQLSSTLAPGVGQAPTLTGVLIVAIGAGAFDDPLYPWISGVFRDPHLPNAQARFGRLYSRARTWLQHVLEHLKGGDERA